MASEDPPGWWESFKNKITPARWERFDPTNASHYRIGAGIIADNFPRKAAEFKDKLGASVAGAGNGATVAMSFGLINRSSEDLGINESLAGYYNGGTTVFSSLPMLPGGGSGIAPKVALSSGAQITVTKSVDVALKQTVVLLASALGQNKPPVQEYEVGEFDDLQKRSVTGDKLDLHHVPQKHPAGQVIPGYDLLKGTAIAIRDKIHKMIPTLKGTYTGTPRKHLATDAWNLRQVGIPNNIVERIINAAKAQHPTDYIKPPKP